jgi:glycyl-tRNA synthetase alpha chain
MVSERIASFLQGKESVYDIEWAPGVPYSEVRYFDELQLSVYNFESADVSMLWEALGRHEAEAQRLIDQRRPSKTRPRSGGSRCAGPTIRCWKCSNLFNLLDARGAISVTERVGVIARVRKIAVGVAQAWVDQEPFRTMKEVA